MENKVTIGIADDHPVYAESLANSINRTADLLVIGTFRSGEELIEYVRIHKDQPQIVLTDYKMPGPVGACLIRALKKLNPKIITIILTALRSDFYFQQCRNAGAAGYITKNSNILEITDAIRQIVAGKILVSDDLPANANIKPVYDPGALTAREIEIVEKIACLKRRDQISVELGISPNTVKNHLASIKNKLRVASDAELIRLYFEFDEKCA